MAILTVGAGQMYSTIAAAVAASKDGDTVKVTAGTYYNDFLTINTKITIQGVGGLARIVAAVSPPNGKAIITTNTDVTLDSLELTGAKVRDLNGAGIRYQGGNLIVRNSYIHNNEEGLLAGNYPTGSITIDHSEIAYNGSNGYAHNVYIGSIGTAVLSNSYIHDSVGGGVEYRSRAANTTIINNRIDDNASSANYTIDLGAGGKVLISGNVIQKTGHAQNRAIIHFGGEHVVPFHPASSLTVSNNTIISDLGTSVGIGILNQSARNGYPVTAQVSNNSLYNVFASRVVSGASNISGTRYLATRPALDTSHPWLSSVAPVTPPRGSSSNSGATPPAGSSGNSGSAPPTTLTSDTLVLHLSTPAGTLSPSFTVSIDGKPLTASPSYLLASTQTAKSADFTFKGLFGGSGSHQVQISFVQDGYTSAALRHLQVTGIDYDGMRQPSAVSSLFPGQSATFTVAGHSS